MSLATYSNLQTAMLDWMGRTGDASPMASRVTDCIALFEARVRREFRYRQMLGTQILAVANQYVDLPTDFLEMKNIYLQTTPTTELKEVGIDAIRLLFNEASLNVPSHFAIVGSQILFAPVPAGAYSAQITYYSFTGLSNSAPTNWLLTSYPDVYLFGALVEAQSFVSNANAVVAWEARYTKAVGEMNAADMRAQLGPSAQMVADLAMTP